MEDSDAQYHHLVEDVVGIATAQLLAAVIGTAALVLFGAGYVGLATEYGRPLGIPYSGLGAVVVGGGALAMTAALPGRYRHVWTDPKARRAVAIGLGQMLVTAAAIALAGYLLAGGWIDLTTPGQLIFSWLYYGLIISGAAQALVAAAAFCLLMLKRELPDVAD